MSNVLPKSSNMRKKATKFQLLTNSRLLCFRHTKKKAVESTESLSKLGFLLRNYLRTTIYSASVSHVSFLELLGHTPQISRWLTLLEASIVLKQCPV